MKMDTKMNGGGGDFDVLRLCAVLGVCLMLCVPLFIGLDVDAGDTEIIAEGGTGTEDDPFTGSVSINTIGALSRTDYYFEVGCDVTIYISDSIFSAPILTPSTGFTVTNERWNYTYRGTSTTVADYSLFVEDSVDRTAILHFIEMVSYPELIFQSDPMTDGTISYGNSQELVVYENENAVSQEGT